MTERFWLLRANARTFGLILLSLAVIGIAAGFYYFGDLLSLENLALRERELRQWQENHLFRAVALSFVIYVAVVGVSLPGATVMTVVLAWLFGFWIALPLVSFASTSGAAIAFWGCRFLFGEHLRSITGRKLEKHIRAFEAEGAYYLFALRLFAGVPFFVINLAMGVTKIRLGTFWWVSQVGMLPGTVVYVYFGASLPSLEQLVERGMGGILSWPLLLSLTLLGVFPLAIKRLSSRFGKTRRPT